MNDVVTAVKFQLGVPQFPSLDNELVDIITQDNTKNILVMGRKAGTTDPYIAFLKIIPGVSSITAIFEREGEAQPSLQVDFDQTNESLVHSLMYTVISKNTTEFFSKSDTTLVYTPSETLAQNILRCAKMQMHPSLDCTWNTWKSRRCFGTDASYCHVYANKVKFLELKECNPFELTLTFCKLDVQYPALHMTYNNSHSATDICSFISPVIAEFAAKFIINNEPVDTQKHLNMMWHTIRRLTDIIHERLEKPDHTDGSPSVSPPSTTL